MLLFIFREGKWQAILKSLWSLLWLRGEMQCGRSSCLFKTVREVEMGLSREFLGITNTAFSLEQGGQSYQMKWCWIEHRMWREYREWKRSWAVHPSHCNFEKKSGKPASFLGESLSSIGAAVWEGRGVKSSRWHCLEWEGRNWGHKEKGNSTYLGMWGWGFAISQRDWTEHSPKRGWMFSKHGVSACCITYYFFVSVCFSAFLLSTAGVCVNVRKFSIHSLVEKTAFIV